MNALSADFVGTTSVRKASKGLSVRDTHWGFVARQIGGAGSKGVEFGFKVVALTMVPTGAAMFFVLEKGPGSSASFADFGIPTATIVIGLALFLFANRGFRNEVQVDALNREIRVGVANAQGNFTCRCVYAARDIHSAFLVRSKAAARPSSLNLRLRGRMRPVCLLEGKESTLQPIFERTTEALTAPKTRKPKAKPKRRRSLLSMPLWKKRAQSFDD